MLSLSTHVLNLVSGLPACALRVRLDYAQDHAPHHDIPALDWHTIAQVATNADGRITDWNLQQQLTSGHYRLHFNLQDYWQAQLPEQQGFFPYAELVFKLDDSRAHWHVPLLISPYGLSTYRGS